MLKYKVNLYLLLKFLISKELILIITLNNLTTLITNSLLNISSSKVVMVAVKVLKTMPEAFVNLNNNSSSRSSCFSSSRWSTRKEPSSCKGSSPKATLRHTSTPT